MTGVMIGLFFALLLLSFQALFAAPSPAPDGVSSLLFTAEILDFITENDREAIVRVLANKGLYKKFLEKPGVSPPDLARFCSGHLSMAVYDLPSIKTALGTKQRYLDFLEELLNLCDPLAWPEEVLNALVEEYLIRYIPTKLVDFSAMSWSLRLRLLEAAANFSAASVWRNLISPDFPVNHADFVNSHGEEGNLIVFVQDYEFLMFLFNHRGLNLNGFVKIETGLITTLTYMFLKGFHSKPQFFSISSVFSDSTINCALQEASYYRLHGLRELIGQIIFK